jgi:DnaJ-class molecular chaperone
MLLLVIAILVGGYLISLRIHPLRKCPVCKMTGRHFGGLYKNSFRRCRKCNGSGRLDRWGTQAFFGGTKNTGVYPKK